MRRAGVFALAAIVGCAGLIALRRAEPGGAAAGADPRLTVTIQAGSGTVTSSPAGISCPQTCSGTFPSGTSVTLTAVPAADFRFDAWSPSSGCTVQPTVPAECRLTISSDRNVGVVFRPAATLQVFPNGDGVVTISPAGLDLATGSPLSRCDPAERDQGCRLAYLPDTQVRATATPASGRTFAGWSDSRCGTGPCTVDTVAGESSLVATFNPLELLVDTSGDGLVTSSPTGISCRNNSGDCAVAAPLGAKFVLDAGAATHEWRFGCDPEGGDPHAARCKATVAGSPTEVGVSFGGAGGPAPPSRISIRLDLAMRGPAKGTVRGKKIDCGQTCSATYKFGDMEELQAVDAPGARFQEWVNGCGTTRVCAFPVGPITSLEAVFAPPLVASFVRVRVSGRGRARELVARVKVNRAAAVSLQLRRNGRRVARRKVGVKAGETPVRLKIPARATAGRYRVVAVVTAGGEQKSIGRFVRVGR